MAKTVGSRSVRASRRRSGRRRGFEVRITGVMPECSAAVICVRKLLTMSAISSGASWNSKPFEPLAHAAEQGLLEAGVEGDDRQNAVVGCAGRRDRLAERSTHGLGQVGLVAGQTGALAEHVEDPNDVSNRHPFVEQILQDPLHLGDRELIGRQFIDDRRIGLAHQIDEVLDFLATEELGGVLADNFGQVGGDHRRAVDDRAVDGIGQGPLLGADPLGG